MVESANLWEGDDLACFGALDRPGDTGTRPGMVHRSLNKAAVRAAGRSAGGSLYSSPFFLSVWPRSWRNGRSARHHWAPACRTGRINRRHTGAVYRASGWTRVGTTQGRGRYDRDRQSDKPKKDVWLRPLRRDWKRTLNR